NAGNRLPHQDGSTAPPAEGAASPAPPRRETTHSQTANPLAETLRKLKGCPKQVKIVRYVWDRLEREAPISQLAKDLYPRSAIDRTVRRQLERTRESLEKKECPLRLIIAANSVQLVEVGKP